MGSFETKQGWCAAAVRRGLSAAALVLACGVLATSARAQAGAKVEICHVPAGTQAPHTLTVGEQVLGVHLAHGDLEGSCAANCEALCDDGDACTIDCDVDTFDLQGCLQAPRPPVDCALLGTEDWCDPLGGCQYEETDCGNGLDDDGDGQVDCETLNCEAECTAAGFDPAGCSDNGYLDSDHTGAVCGVDGPEGVEYRGVVDGAAQVHTVALPDHAACVILGVCGLHNVLDRSECGSACRLGTFEYGPCHAEPIDVDADPGTCWALCQLCFD